MMELEKFVGEIPLVSGGRLNTFGFIAVDNQVVELGLFQKRLDSLSGNIGNLTSLTHLDLRWKNLTSLPESIINLRSLNYLDLSHNHLNPLSVASKKWLKQLKENGCIVYL